MKIFDKKFGIALCCTFLCMVGVLAFSVKSSYAAPALGVPEITSFAKSSEEENALQLDYKTNNTGTDFSIEAINATTKTTNNLAGSVTSYTYQNLEEGKEYKVQIRACTNSTSEYVCSDWSEVKSAIAGAMPIGLKSIKLDNTQFVYDGKTKTPTVTVVDSNDATLTKDQDYTVTLPEKRIDIGKYEVTVNGIGNYNFSKKVSFVINPPKTSISSVISTKNTITVKWNAAKGGVKYQVGYKKATASKYKFTANTSSTSKKITGLAQGTKYNVVVRCFKKVNNVDYIGANSTAKTKSTTGKATSSSNSSNSSNKSGSKSGNVISGSNGKKPQAGVDADAKKKACTNSGGKWNSKNKKCGGCPLGKVSGGAKCVPQPVGKSKKKCSAINENWDNKKKKCNGCKYGYSRNSSGFCYCSSKTKKCYSNASNVRKANKSSAKDISNKGVENTKNKKKCKSGETRSASGACVPANAVTCNNTYGKTWKNGKCVFVKDVQKDAKKAAKKIKAKNKAKNISEAKAKANKQIKKNVQKSSKNAAKKYKTQQKNMKAAQKAQKQKRKECKKKKTCKKGLLGKLWCQITC